MEANLQLPVELNLNVVQEAKVQLLADHICLTPLQEQSSTMVGCPHAPEEIRGDIVLVIR